MLYCGGDERERRARLDAAVGRLAPLAAVTYVLPEGIGTLDRYVREAQKAFPVTSPIGLAREKMSWNQVWDVHLDWATTRRSSALVVWPEIDGRRWREDLELGEILADYVLALEEIDAWEGPGQPWFRLVGSCPQALGGLDETVRLHVGRGDDAPPEVEVARRRLRILAVQATPRP